MDVIESGGTDWRVSFSASPAQVLSDTEYTLSFWAKAGVERPLAAWAQQERPSWKTYLWYDNVLLTTDSKHYEMSGTADGDDPGARLYFGVGEVTGSVWFDDVRLQVGARRVWHRDYGGGVVLINAGGNPRSVSLGGTFQKIRGKQAPEINDGSLVTRVTLPPVDGLILLRHGTALQGKGLPFILSLLLGD